MHLRRQGPPSEILRVLLGRKEVGILAYTCRGLECVVVMPEAPSYRRREETS